MQSWNLITQKHPQLKRMLPKFLLQCYFRLTVLQVLNKNVHEKLSYLGSSRKFVKPNNDREEDQTLVGRPIRE